MTPLPQENLRPPTPKASGLWAAHLFELGLELGLELGRTGMKDAMPNALHKLPVLMPVARTRNYLLTMSVPH